MRTRDRLGHRRSSGKQKRQFWEILLGVAATLHAGLACSSSSLSTVDDDAHGPSATTSDVQGMQLKLSVTSDRPTFVELRTPSRLTVAADGHDSIAWDLAFQGRDIFTNGGISGPGNASAFGPLSPPTFLSDTAPDVPVFLQDEAGGAFLGWYEYDGQTHQVLSRFHVYGLRDGARLYKLQVLSYYGGQDLSVARYRLRYAEVFEGRVGPTRELSDIDATAGGSKPTPADASACLDLENGQLVPLTLAEAPETDVWHVCLRRDSIAVNGGRSGRRGVEAVDLQALLSPAETVEELQAKTAASELPRFDEVDFTTLSAEPLDWATDGVASAFGGRWLESGSEPPRPAESVWLVVAADGSSNHLLKFESLAGDPGSKAGAATLTLRVKAVR